MKQHHIQLKAKHFKDTAWHELKNCPISKAVLDLKGNMSVSSTTTHVYVTKGVFFIFKRKEVYKMLQKYTKDDFTRDYEFAKLMHFKDVVVRSISFYTDN